MSFIASSPNNRLIGAVGAVLVQGALIYALLVGLAVQMGKKPEEALAIFSVVPPPPPPPPRERIVPHRVHSKRAEGAASPPNLRAQRTELVVPPPVVVPPVTPPMVTAPVAGVGNADHAGAATVPGPGSGSGGIGNGNGSGKNGDGDGDGGDEIAPRLRKGRLKDSDYPKAAAEAGIGGTVGVRYLVETDGRVTNCTVTRSSGSGLLDATTCRLIEQRFRYDPSRDARGRPVRSLIVENHSWDLQHVVEGDDD